jgi:hypothetical protein
MRWEALRDAERRLYATRVWLPEAGGWIYMVFEDWMRSDRIVATVFVPSLEAWKVADRSPISVGLDIGHVVHTAKEK